MRIALALMVATSALAAPARSRLAGAWHGVGCMLTLAENHRYTGRADEGTEYHGTWREEGDVLVLRGARGGEVRYHYQARDQRLLNDRNHVVFARAPLKDCLMCDPPLF